MSEKNKGMTIQEIIEQNKMLDTEIVNKQREIAKLETTKRELRVKAKELILPTVKYPIGFRYPHKHGTSTEVQVVDVNVHLYEKPSISYRIAPILKGGKVGKPTAYGISEFDIDIILNLTNNQKS